MSRAFPAAALAVASLVLLAPSRGAAQTVAEFADHLESLMPALLSESGVPGAAVALVEDGEVVRVRGWGSAGGVEPVGPETVFNAGSISKSVTAWAVMALVERGALDLDAAAARYLDEAGPRLPDGVTIRRLLAHTAGTSLPAVPGYAPGEPVPAIERAVADADSGVAVVVEPGTEWRYSGGGYGILQLVVERVSGRAFDAFVRETVLEPLGMRCSGFGPPGSTGCRAAVPHDTLGRPVADLAYAMTAAAGLRTTALDLARLVAAGLPGPAGEPVGRGVLAPATVELLHAPAPGAEQGYGLAYGLGHNLIPLPGGGRSAGHAGSNPGWAAVATAIPATGDGIVVLTNGDAGLGVYKWALCDWVEWKAGAPYPVFCDGRDARPAGTLHARSAVVDSIVAARVVPDGPGAAVVVRRAGRAIHRAGYGIADLERGRRIRPATPFYVASVAKPVTAAAVAALVERGDLDPDARLGSILPEAPPYAADVRVRDLLAHASGIPDYYATIDWTRFRSIDDAAVLDTLANREGLDFAPGTRYDYSNSNYVLLSRIVERVGGRPLAESVATAAESIGARLVVDRGERPVAPGRAIGYAPADSAGWRVSDHETVDLPGVGTVEFRMATTGSSGLFASADDLARWAEAWFVGEIVARDVVERFLGSGVAVPDPPVGGPTRAAWGWFVSDLGGRRIVWHDGARGGFRAALLHDPAADLVVAVTANAADLDALDLAVDVAAALAAGQRPAASARPTPSERPHDSSEEETGCCT